MHKIILISIFFIGIFSKAQENRFYSDAYQTIDNMLNDKQKYSFKEGVFAVENAYYQGKYDTVELNNKIKFLKHFCNLLLKNRKLTYTDKDEAKVNKYAAIYTVMCEATPVIMKNDTVKYKPFAYDFEDVFGHTELSNLFVSKLLDTQKGNCNSMPYLYKILAEELGVDANLALAPNHVYIKHNIKSIGWYNTELTSGIFPIDAWLSASGFIHLDAIKNGVFMKALNNKESLALLLVDLANAYNRNYPGNDGSFALKCAERAIQIYSYLPNALLLQAETHTKQFQKLMKEQNTKDIQATLSNPKAKELFDTMNKEYTYIHKIGYRSMPEEMYLDWLVSLKTERSKYEDTRLSK
ncbi:hypothetical protein [Chryseobacterium culicis]|uniref:Protein SirB1 N-terminal domain-containing protein n=1 Tax=Chryseobacterium culicis TaxID=680127 RepID=A0A1H6H092_CHRCI|nr:hypothetical protein [Chryseobacterium culicis]SEH27493.1 hypothetical protein SAMN05421593_0331 [Chryseobacterium culicis]